MNGPLVQANVGVLQLAHLFEGFPELGEWMEHFSEIHLFTRWFLLQQKAHLPLAGDQISKDLWRFHSNLGSPVETLAYLLTQRETTTFRVLVGARCVGCTYNKV